MTFQSTIQIIALSLGLTCSLCSVTRLGEVITKAEKNISDFWQLLEKVWATFNYDIWSHFYYPNYSLGIGLSLCSSKDFNVFTTMHSDQIGRFLKFLTKAAKI